MPWWGIVILLAQAWMLFWSFREWGKTARRNKYIEKRIARLRKYLEVESPHIPDRVTHEVCNLLAGIGIESD